MTTKIRKPEIHTPRPADPRVKVRFTNLETPGVDLSFTYEGTSYHLEDGQEVTLPRSVVDHLNGLAVPERAYAPDPATGQLSAVYKGMRHRFSCQFLEPAPREA